MLHWSKVISWIFSSITVFYREMIIMQSARTLQGFYWSVTSAHTVNLRSVSVCVAWSPASLECHHSWTVCYHQRISCNNLSPTMWGAKHPARDCAVSDWSFWSGCAEPCQPSVRVRVRHIEQQPSNSGEPCPSLEQRGGCREYRDRQGGHCGLNSGMQIQQHATCSGSLLFYLILYAFPLVYWTWFGIFKWAKPEWTNRNTELFSLIRTCIHHQHGVWQGEAQARQLWKPPGPWVGFTSCTLKLHTTSGILKFKSWKVHECCQGLTSF